VSMIRSRVPEVVRFSVDAVASVWRCGCSYAGFTILALSP